MSYNLNFDNPSVEAYVRQVGRDDKISSTFPSAHPAFAFFMAKNELGKGALQNPTTGAVFGQRLPAAKMKMATGDAQWYFRIQAQQLDSQKNVGYRDTLPTSDIYASDIYHKVGVKWAKKAGQVKLSKDDERAAKNGGDAANMHPNMLADAVAAEYQVHIDSLASDFINGTLTSTQQANDINVYPNILGILHTVSDGETSGETSYTHLYGQDRTVSGYDALQANVKLAATLTSAGILTGTKPELRMIRAFDSTYGMALKQYGAPDLFLTHGSLWDVLAEQCDDKQSRVMSSKELPNVFYDSSATNFPVIVLNGSRYIIFDNSFPTGTMVGLNSNTWSIHVENGYNFNLGPWVDPTKYTSGAEEIIFRYIETHLRTVCEAPFANWKVTGLTTS
jgi:hypothetical protein